ncbi:YceI family protein [Polluticoccus soli]|uniref:YceI family protein n=1 Tax=Polluticoccus soli TaxID=3034150 RepID=UPI0023E2BE7A|nr:YceI family protein [Flavipsychrobacter sp. JY13-12]
MKKMMIVAVLVCSSTTLFAQKYMTRTGKASFFSATSLENIEAFNNEVAGIVDSKSGDVVFQVPIKSFKFEKALMQEHFNENYMESDKFPKAEFKGKIVDLSGVNFSKDGTYNVKTNGKLTIHGVTRDVSMPGTVVVKGNTATVSSKFNVKTADYNISIPKMVEGKVAKTIEVTVNSILTQK